MSQVRCPYRRPTDGLQCFKTSGHGPDHDFPSPSLLGEHSPGGLTSPGYDVPAFVSTAIGTPSAEIPPMRVEILPWTTCLTPKDWGQYHDANEPGWYSSVGLDIEPKLSASGEGLTTFEATQDALRKLLPMLQALDENTLTDEQKTNRIRVITLIQRQLNVNTDADDEDENEEEEEEESGDPKVVDWTTIFGTGPDALTPAFHRGAADVLDETYEDWALEVTTNMLDCGNIDLDDFDAINAMVRAEIERAPSSGPEYEQGRNSWKEMKR